MPLAPEGIPPLAHLTPRELTSAGRCGQLGGSALAASTGGCRSSVTLAFAFTRDAEEEVTMSRTTVALVLLSWIAAGCSGGARSTEGESCAKTADCKDGLRCVSLVCTRSSADAKKELSAYLDKFLPAYCAWLADACSSSDTQADCLAEIEQEGIKSEALACQYNVDFYQQHKAAMDACLTASPPCKGTDDPDAFCAILDGLDFEHCQTATPPDGGGGKLDGGGSPGCVQTTFEVTNWPGTSYNNSLYTGTSWQMDDCTEIQSDDLTITVRCPKNAFGNARLISEGCGVLGIAAPGNVLTDVGAAPSSGNKCSGQTVSNTSITCYQECHKLLRFKITSGPCT